MTNGVKHVVNQVVTKGVDNTRKCWAKGKRSKAVAGAIGKIVLGTVIGTVIGTMFVAGMVCLIPFAPFLAKDDDLGY